MFHFINENINITYYRSPMHYPLCPTHIIDRIFLIQIKNQTYHYGKILAVFNFVELTNLIYSM